MEDGYESEDLYQNDLLDQYDLDPYDQEVYDDKQSDISPENEESCDSESENWNNANLNGLTYSGHDKLSDAIDTLKNIIYMSFFQLGKKEEVHDEGVNRRYMDYLAKVGNNIIDYSNNRTDDLQIVELESKPELTKSLNAFITVFKDIYTNIQGETERSLCRDFLKLHFKCFPYCQREECLSMD